MRIEALEEDVPSLDLSGRSIKINHFVFDFQIYNDDDDDDDDNNTIIIQ